MRFHESSPTCFFASKTPLPERMEWTVHRVFEIVGGNKYTVRGSGIDTNPLDNCVLFLESPALEKPLPVALQDAHLNIDDFPYRCYPL